jgi:hypothetical protein
MSAGVREPSSRVHPTRISSAGFAKLNRLKAEGEELPAARIRVMGTEMVCSPYWRGQLTHLINSSVIRSPIEGATKFDVTGTSFDIVPTGVIMSTINEELRQVNDEVVISAKVLKELAADVRGLRDKIEPELLEHVRALRQARMTVVQEMRDTLSILGDVRKFFIEDDYKTEMERLERFVAVCERLRGLKQDGTLDAVCDSALRLAMKEGGQP